jgi:succinate dehydrogenase/fumarate reductase cytochrome b subunit
LKLGRVDQSGGELLRGRQLAHLAFAAPSLRVGFGNIAGVFHARMAVPYAWLGLWVLLAAATLAAPERAVAAIPTPVPHRRLAIAHGLSASAILLLFILPHIANHLTGIWSGATHIALMKQVRLLYRDEIVEPLLLALIAFQICSGTVLVRRRLATRSDFFGTLQTLTGVYVGIYLLAHMTAAFAARFAGTDTNWNWLTSNDQGLLSQLSSFTLVAHYWLGPVAIVTHVACGLRLIMLERGISPAGAGRIAWGLIGLGAIASSVILAGLLGVHSA